MNGTEYSKKMYNGFPTYQKIAKDAFNEGLKQLIPSNEEKLEKELKKVKDELKDLWKTIDDPEGFVNLI